MGPTHAESRESNESGSHLRLDVEGGSTGLIEKRQNGTRQTLSKRLRRNIGRITKAFALISSSGRLQRVELKDPTDPTIEDTKEMVTMSLEAFVEGLVCVGALAESLKLKFDLEEDQHPFQLVADIIEHTANTIFDHPFFKENGVDPNDSLLVEETPTSIDLLIKSGDEYKSIRCEELIDIPEAAEAHLDQIVRLWSHFWGKQYDISCFYELEVFEKLADLKERAKPMNQFFGALIRAFDDAVDRRRAELKGVETEDSDETELQAPPIKHGISQPSFPLPTPDELESDLEASEARLLDMDDQFDDTVDEQIERLMEIALFGFENLEQPHQVVDGLPEPSSKLEHRLNEIYRDLIPVSTLNCLNPRTFLLALIEQYARKLKREGRWDVDRFDAAKVADVLWEMAPGRLLLGHLSSTVGDGDLKDEGFVDDLFQQYGKFAEVSETGVFPHFKGCNRIVTSELLAHDTLSRPEKKFSIRDHLIVSSLLDGEAKTPEDRIARVFVGVLQTLTGKTGATPGSISGFFYILTGGFLEGKRWIKPDSQNVTAMKARCEWLQGVFAEDVLDEDISEFMMAFFGFLHQFEKDQWDGSKEGTMGLFKIMQEKAKKIQLDATHEQAFCQAYDQPYQFLGMTLGEFLGDCDENDNLRNAAEALQGFWYQSLKVIMLIKAGLFRGDPRLIGHLRRVRKQAIDHYTLPEINGKDCISILKGWEKRTGHLSLLKIENDGTMNLLGLKVRGRLYKTEKDDENA